MKFFEEEKLPINIPLDRFSLAYKQLDFNKIFLTGGTSNGMASNKFYLMEELSIGWKWTRTT